MISKAFVSLHTAVCILLLLHLDAIDAVHLRATQSLYNTSELLSFSNSTVAKTNRYDEDSKSSSDNDIEKIRLDGIKEEYKETVNDIKKQKKAGTITKEEVKALKELAKIKKNTDKRGENEAAKEGIRKEYLGALANIRKQMIAGDITEKEAEALEELAAKTLNEKAVLVEENQANEFMSVDSSELFNTTTTFIEDVMDNNDSLIGIENTNSKIKAEYKQAVADIKEKENAGAISKEEAKALEDLAKQTKKENEATMKEAKNKIKEEYKQTLDDIKKQKKAGNISKEEAKALEDLAKKIQNYGD